MAALLVLRRLVLAAAVALLAPLWAGRGALAAQSGDMTYFTPGLGACGTQNTADDPIVALSAQQFPGGLVPGVGVGVAGVGVGVGPQYRGPCGQQISISLVGAPGWKRRSVVGGSGMRWGLRRRGTVTATVTDKCPECAAGDIDASPAVFRQLSDMSKGRVKVQWEFV